MRFPLLLLFSVLCLHAETLDEILSRMDQAAQKFQSFSAKMKRLDYNAVLDETSENTGTMRLKKSKGGAQGLVDFDEPDRKTVHLNGKVLEIYYPKANTQEIYDAGKHVSTMDEIVLLGFGTSGADLRKNYQTKLADAETIGAVKTSRLELIPKSEEVKKLVNKIELWIPEGQSNPIQEKLTQPSKNYNLVTFTDIKVNPPLQDADFNLKVPPGVKKVYPQK